MENNEWRENFPCLNTFNITECPKSVEFPVIPSITDLIMSRNNAMLIRSMMNLTSLSSLVIEVMDDELTVLLDGLLQNHKMLEIESLLEGLQNSHSLRKLYIWECNNFLSLPMNGLRGLSSLRILSISSYNKFYSLFEGIQYLIALEDLYIEECPKLISLP